MPLLVIVSVFEVAAVLIPVPPFIAKVEVDNAAVVVPVSPLIVL